MFLKGMFDLHQEHYVLLAVVQHVIVLLRYSLTSWGIIGILWFREKVASSDVGYHI